jgi:starvation-inducible DNA-binding protein
MKEARIGIKTAHLIISTEVLNKILADEFVLYTKTRNAHWNIEGPDFFEQHHFFELQYEQIDASIDAIAERIRALGHYPQATLEGILKRTHLSEATRERNNGAGLIKELLGDHERIITYLREQIIIITDQMKDYGTSDFITSLLQIHEKMAWMLRAHL